MRNLKKVLSLVLAVAMMVSICVVGAGAVNYDDFKDEGTITKKQAVETLVSLDVLNGYNGGETFAPTQPVTRAEMATIICRILAGGESLIPDATKEVPTYTDIDGHWAESYIEYCTSLGIVSGKGNGIFDPQANVTAAEAAKMVMTTLGYNADIEGFKGAGWDINTMAKANTLKLTANLVKEISANVAITREQVAQLIYNALSTPVVQNYTGTVANTWISSGKDAYQETLLETKFNAEKVTGVVIANEYADLYGETGIKKGTTELALLDGDNDMTKETKTVKVSTGILDLGSSVTVFWNKDTKQVVYGNFQDTGLNQITEITMGEKLTGRDLLDAKALTNNTEYFLNYDNGTDGTEQYTADLKFYYHNANGEQKTVRAGSTVSSTLLEGDILNSYNDGTLKYGNSYAVVNEEYTWSQFVKTFLSAGKNSDYYELSDLEHVMGNGQYVRAVDYNNDGDIDYVMMTTFTMTQLTSVSKKGVVKALADGSTITYTPAADAKDTDNAYVTEDELAVDDVVLTATIDEITYISKADSFEGEVNSYSYKKDVLTVEGTDYEHSAIDNWTGYFTDLDTAEKKVNYVYYVDFFGNISCFAMPAGAADQYVLLTDGWYAEKRTNDEYAVKAWLDEEIKDTDVTSKTGPNFINDNADTQNNSWGNLYSFENSGKTNVAAYTMNDEGMLSLNDVKAYIYNKQHKATNIKVDYVDLAEQSFGKGENTFTGSYAIDSVDAKLNLTSEDINTGDNIKVQANKDTVFYYVSYDKKGNVDEVKVVVGYKNVLAVTDPVSMYAVATNVSGDSKSDAYWVADIIVIETEKPVIEKSKDVVFGYYVENKTVKDYAYMNSILADATLNNITDTNEYNDLKQGDTPMAFYTNTVLKNELSELDEITKDFASYGIFVATVDRAADLYDYVVTVGGTKIYNLDNAVVYGMFNGRRGSVEARTTDADGDDLTITAGDKIIIYANKKDNAVYVINVTKSDKIDDLCKDSDETGIYWEILKDATPVADTSVKDALAAADAALTANDYAKLAKALEALDAFKAENVTGKEWSDLTAKKDAVKQAMAALMEAKQTAAAKTFTTFVETFSGETVPGSNMAYGAVPAINPTIAGGYSKIWAVTDYDAVDAAEKAAEDDVLKAVKDYVNYLIRVVYESKKTGLDAGELVALEDAFNQAVADINAAETPIDAINAYHAFI